MNALLTVRNLKKTFKKEATLFHALSDISFDVMKGDSFGIIGFSGAGKSTLLRCLCSLDKASSGEIIAFGQSLSTLSSHEILQFRRQIGMVFQHFQLFSSKTVFENIAYPLELIGIPYEQIVERVQELLLLVGLQPKAHAYPAQLSGGEKQRVGIARAIAHNPKILFCDEPTSALDTKNKREILALLKSLQTKLQLTIVLITHEMSLIKEFCNKVAVLENGQLVELGYVSDIFVNPTHSTTKKLVDQTLHEIPEHLKKRASLYRLVFKGETASEPIISKLVRDHHIDVNILMGWIDSFENITIGNLLIELLGSHEEIAKSVEYLENQQVKVEKIIK